MEFCPVCMLRKALADGVESGESSASEDTIKPTAEQAAQRFEHYELVTDEDGKPVELGRGAMGVTYKAFDVDLRCPVTLKVISERYLGDESAQLRFLREARAAANVGSGVDIRIFYYVPLECGRVFLLSKNRVSTCWSILTGAELPRSVR